MRTLKEELKLYNLSIPKEKEVVKLTREEKRIKPNVIRRRHIIRRKHG